MKKFTAAVEVAAAAALHYGLGRLLAVVVTHAEERETREVCGRDARVPVPH